MKVSMFVSSLLVLSLAPLASCDDAGDDNKKIEGAWVPVAAELAGTKLPSESLKKMKLVLKDEKYTFKNGDESDRGTIKLDSTKKPRIMDIKGTEGANKDKTILTIYELTEDKLIVCYDLSGKNRPTEFKTKADTKLFLVTYQREKP